MLTLATPRREAEMGTLIGPERKTPTPLPDLDSLRGSKMLKLVLVVQERAAGIGIATFTFLRKWMTESSVPNPIEGGLHRLVLRRDTEEG